MLITKNSVFVRIVTGIWRVHITVTCILGNILAIFSLRKNETGQYISIKSTINWLSVTIIASCRKQTTFSCLIFLHIVFSFAENQLSLNQIHIRQYVALCINLYLWMTIFWRKKNENKNKSYKTPAPGLECLHLLTPLVFQHAWDEVRNL